MKDRSQRLYSARRVADIVAEVASDDEVLRAVDAMRNWKLESLKANDQVFERDRLELLLAFLNGSGRCKLARQIEEIAELPPSAETLILGSNATEAVSRYKESKGERVEGATIHAAHVCRAGKPTEAVAFLQLGWPDWNEHWSRDLCLELAYRGYDVAPLVDSIGDVPRRKALLKACERLRDFPKTYAAALTELDIKLGAEILQPDDVVATAQLIAACGAQREHRAFEPLVAVSHALLAAPRPPKGVKRIRDSDLRLCLLKELLSCRIEFEQFDSIAGDLAAAKRAMSETVVHQSLMDAVSRAVKAHRLNTMSRLDDSLPTPIERAFARLGFVQGIAGAPEELQNLEDHVRQKLKLSFWSRLMDDLYE